MNGTGMTPTPYGYGEVGSSMKVLLLLVIVFAAFIFIASTSLANVDLTPDTPAVVSNPAVLEDSTIVGGYEIVTIQNDSPVVLDSGTGTGQDVIAVPVTGTCSDPYVVRQGDMLSSIAVLCDTTIADIRLANPEIVNANMIYAGQQIRIPSQSNAALPVPVPVTSVNETAPQVVTNPLGTQDMDMAVISPGTGVQATGINFPPNTPVYIAIGPRDTGYTITASGTTDQNGSVAASIIVPAAPDANDPWVVVITTTETPVIQAASAPFLIQP